jgi:hypothetical protein
MKQLNLKAFSCAALALLVPIFAQAAGSVTLSTPVQSPSGASVSSGLPVTITVNATPVGGALINTVNLIYSHNNGTRQWWVTNAMTWVSGVVYSGVIPPLPTGTVSYRVSCRFNDVETTQTALAQYTVLDVPSIDSGRYMPFETLWANPVGTNYYFDVAAGRWLGSGLFTSTLLSNRPIGGENRTYLIRSIVGAYIQSPPLVGGVGTIYFTSRPRQPNQTQKIHVQVSTNGVPVESQWETVRILNYPRTDPSVNIATPVVLNRADIRCVRFVMTEDSPYDGTPAKTDGAVAFDNIVLSSPPADIRMEERLRNPGYPSRDQNVKMRCAVIDTNPNAPAVNHQVTVYYQWLQNESARPQAGGWLSTNMYPVGGGVFEGVIPQREPGFVHYYYRFAFDGYFYSRDPDGAPGTEPTNSENLSPNYWSDGDSLPGAPIYYSKYEVRSFRSEYGEVWLDAVPVQATVPMDLVGDESWQGITLVTGITNLNWHFIGLNRYTNNAPAYLAAPVIWGENDQSFANPPIGGTAEIDATNGIIAELEYEGFLLMRLNTVGRDYIAKRAVYQNFDQWLASKTEFEESLGLYAVLKYEEDFDAWADDGYTVDQSKGEPFQNDTPSATFSVYPVQTANGWVMQQGRVLAERKIDTKTTTLVNQALLLNGLGGGRVGNSGDSLTMGIEKMTYSMRASFNDRYAAIFTNDFSFAHGQQIETTFSAAQLSPEFPYISVMASYHPDAFLGASYYEIRFIQSNETVANQTDNWLTGEVWRWNAGSTTPTKIGATQTIGSGKLIVDKVVTIIISGTSPSVTIQVLVNGLTTRTYTDSASSRLTTGGTVGFLTHDAVPVIKSVSVKTYPALATLMTATDFDTPRLALWYLGGSRADGGGHRWSKVTHSDTTIRLTRQVPTQLVSIYKAVRRPGAPGPATEDLVLQHAGIVVNSLAYTPLTESIKQWNEGFVEIRYQSGDVDVAIDEPRLYPWRANTRSADNSENAEVLGVKYYDWTSKDQQYEWLKNKRGWAVLEGMVTNALSVRGNDVHLERSRANPSLDQALVSPVLTNGIGILNFVYTVSGGTAIYAVERTDEGVQQNWTTIATFTNTVGQTGTRYVAVRENFTGRIRIRMLATSNINAKLMIDDAEARDYPPRDDTTWQAYNVLVTDLQTNRLYSGQSCYLNNSATAGVGGTGVALSEHQPFVQTPSVGTGIGEIAFWYRSWSGTPTTLTLKVAPTPDTPDANWVLITNLTVSGTSYVYFNNPNIYDLDNHVLRVYSSTNGADRICIDNVLVTEPVRASFEIQSVRLDPAQPLVNAPVAVEVDIGRFLMNPKNVRVYLSYHAGSNDWGTANWWTPENTPTSRRLELLAIAPGSRTYRTPSGTPIPASFTIDSVVQYLAWGTHYEVDANASNPSMIVQGTAPFVNPAWYAPINLNSNYVTKGWSPYYFVYSCPPYSVWVNELNSALDGYEPVGDFVELIGPAQADISGWRIELSNYSLPPVVQDFCVITTPTLLNDKINGWGFFVWGDASVANVNQTFATVKYKNVPQHGGLRLIRSCGAVEQKLCFGTSARGNLQSLGYTYIGFDDGWDPVALAMRTSKANALVFADFYWPSSPSDFFSPGNVNVGESLGELAPPPTGYVLLTSVIGPHGLHDGVATTLISEQVTTGSSAGIPYAADPWYRIGTFKSNGATVADAIGLSNYLWQAASMTTDISNHVTFVAVNTYGENIPISWLAGWSEQAVAAGDGDPFSVDQEFLMNTDPTLTTTANLKVTAINFVGTTMQVTVKMERNTITPFNAGDINGMLYLQSRASLLSGTFEDVAGTAITGAVFNDGAGGDEHTYTFEGITNANLFYRAVIK